MAPVKTGHDRLAFNVAQESGSESLAKQVSNPAASKP